MVIEGGFTFDGEHTIQYTGDVLQNWTLDVYIILLTSVTSINSLRKQNKKDELIHSL